MKKLKVEQFNHPLNKMMCANYRIVEDDSTQFPVCNFGLSSLEQQPEALLKKQERYAKLLASAPELLKALQGMLERFDYNDQVIYSFAAKEIDAAKEAIKKATE
ncbi:hypothetical protein [Bacteroides thetaiotaomicron]|jgi:hypothetical protein|uniref:hypothetical protein n=1 Tax=Bacteroides thetaiotaomicron TaxID=818 RepID=UPI00101CB8E9|nr:hypothetical protein [Bacteroides thetaiotaomicron]